MEVTWKRPAYQLMSEFPTIGALLYWAEVKIRLPKIPKILDREWEWDSVETGRWGWGWGWGWIHANFGSTPMVEGKSGYCGPQASEATAYCVVGGPKLQKIIKKRGPEKSPIRLNGNPSISLYLSINLPGSIATFVTRKHSVHNGSRAFFEEAFSFMLKVLLTTFSCISLFLLPVNCTLVER
jgi:hypothetical protein